MDLNPWVSFGHAWTNEAKIFLIFSPNPIEAILDLNSNPERLHGGQIILLIYFYQLPSEVGSNRGYYYNIKNSF